MKHFAFKLVILHITSIKSVTKSNNGLNTSLIGKKDGQCMLIKMPRSNIDTMEIIHIIREAWRKEHLSYQYSSIIEYLAR